MPGLDSLHFRNGRQGVLSFIQATYANGLHMVQGNPALVRSTHADSSLTPIIPGACELLFAPSMFPARI